MNCFADYARFYNLLYQDRDYAVEAERVVSVLKTHLPGARSVLDLGCGTGRLATLLSREGLTVAGVDLSESMLREADSQLRSLPAEEAGRLSYRLGDVRTVRLPGPFDAVISLFHVMSYQQTDADLEAAFATAAAHLSAGGLFLFDFWYGPAVLSQRPETRVKRCEDAQVRLLRIAEPKLHPGENLVDVNYQTLAIDKGTGALQEMTETHVMRYLFLPEVRSLLARCGFQPLQACAWPSGDAPDETTWGVAIVARKE